jgi:hypothetical protein
MTAGSRAASAVSALVRPAPDDIEGVLEITRAADQAGEILGKTGAIGKRGGEFGGQHRIEEGRALRQEFRQQWRLGHDVGDQ